MILRQTSMLRLPLPPLQAAKQLLPPTQGAETGAHRDIVPIRLQRHLRMVAKYQLLLPLAGLLAMTSRCPSRSQLMMALV